MHVIIPAKAWPQAKTRLSPALSVDQRIRLSRRLLIRTIHLANQVGETVVISGAEAVRRAAKQAGAWALVEAGAGLNEAVLQAAQWTAARGAEASLILPADLPFLTLDNLIGMIRLGQTRPAVVIAPCRRRQGTNALLVRPPTLIEFNFGPDSFELHRQVARTVGVEAAIYHSPTVAFDLDTPEDLEAAGLNAIQSGFSCGASCEAMY